jgi:DNA-binding NtrC family response regulator
MKEGAQEYIVKPCNPEEISLLVDRIIKVKNLQRENLILRKKLARHYNFQDIISKNAKMNEIFDLIREIASLRSTVLVQGESGTGKELIARAIHYSGDRANKPFVAVSCAALAETLLESELFGHERGAFTGAERRRRGLFAEASGGTLFLDEIADMSLALQAKLLRALQDKTVRPVGGNEETRLDVRVISATNRDLAGRVSSGTFREDLYYRLAVIPIRLPSLRERRDDIPVLAQHFLQRAAARLGKSALRFSDEAMDWLVKQPWPGNVRQLENVVERAATLTKEATIIPADLTTDFGVPGATGDHVRPTLGEIEKQYIDRVLAETKGDKNAAARILGVSVRTLQRMFRLPES